MSWSDWILLLVVAIIGAGMYMLLNEAVNNTVLVLSIAVTGFIIGKLSNIFFHTQHRD
ncbi:hypothetical protein [Exiguobacterium sp. s122]|nr:hypothetical protein [Exiguobacterium sp. s122]